jgi:hypothetical protein
MNELIISIGAMVSLFVVWLSLTVMFDVFKAILDIKFELEDINRELKKRTDKPWNYTMKELEEAIKHE